MDKMTGEKIDRFVEEHREEILSDLSTLIAIPSVSIPGSKEPEPFGKACAEVLDTALGLAKKHGLTTENHSNWYGIAHQGEGPRVGIFAHLDVVEAGEGWQTDPFTMAEKDGWLFGRGVADDKGAAVIALYAARAVRELELQHHMRLEVYFGTSEEKGMSDLDRYLKENEEPDFSMVPDFLWPVSLGSTGTLRWETKWEMPFLELDGLSGGKRSESVPLTASVIYTGDKKGVLLSLEKGCEGVSILPLENALMIQVQGKAPSSRFSKDGISAVERLCGLLTTVESPLTEVDKERLLTLLQLSQDTRGQLLGIAAADPFFGPLTNRLSTLETVDSVLTLSFVTTYPYGIRSEELLQKLAAGGTEAKILRVTAPWLFPPDDERIPLLTKACCEVLGGENPPRVGGSTYAQMLKNAVNFGPKDTNLYTPLPKGHGNIHGPDECRSISSILDAVRIYARALAALDAWYGQQKQ